MLGRLTPITKNIIILNVVVYVYVNFIGNTEALETLLSSYYPGSPNFHSWQIITHMFMHAGLNDSYGISHILFNMFTLWSFGPVLEQTLGARRYILLYFLSGIAAFALFNVWNFVEVQSLCSELESLNVNPAVIYQKAAFSAGANPQVSLPPEAFQPARELMMILRSKMLGASGAIFGVVAAFSTLFPNAKLIFLFIPFPIKAKYIFPAVIVISLYLGFSGSMDGVAHFAHIGGAVAGFLMALYWKKKMVHFG